MKNLFKKLLACCLAVCMVLTLCVGALTVSAEVTDNYVKVGSVEVTTEETAVVPVSILSTGGIAAAEINVSVPNLTISKLELVTTDTNVMVAYANAADPTGAQVSLDKVSGYSSEVAPNIINNVFTYIVHLPANTVTTAEVTLNITFAALAVGTYDIAVDCESCKDSTSDLLTLEEIDGAITVVEAGCKHAETVEIPAVAATCTETGLTAGEKCAACDEILVAQEEVEALGHTEVEIPAVDATCTTAGATAGVKCSVCDAVITAPEATEALGHSYDDGVIDPAPSCNEAGVKTYTCGTCDDTYTEAVEATGHTEVAYEDVEATCTTAGQTGGTYCSVCEAEITAPTVVEALGHTYVDGTCSVCGAADPDYVAPCEHEWEVEEATAAIGTGTNASTMTTTTPGSIDFVCSKCDAEDHVDDVQYWSRHVFYIQNINMATQIELLFHLRNDRFNDSTLGNGEEGFAMVTVDAESGSETDYIEGLEDIEVTNNGSRDVRIVSVGLAAKQMTDDVTATTFIKVNGVWYSGMSQTNSIKDKAHALFGDIGETEKTLYANLLVYGARAQEYLNYKIDDLADTDLGDYEPYVTQGDLEIEDNITQTYSSEGAATYIPNNKYSLSMAAKTEALIFFRTNRSNTTIEHVTAVLQYGEGEDVVTTNIDSSSMLVDPSYPTSTNRYYLTYVDVYPKCMRDTVTLKYYIDGEYANNTVTFSIEDIVANVCASLTDTEEISMYQAMLKYADAAKAHFG